MKSMTGFGKGIAEKDFGAVTVEIKSVNHKQFDLSVKMPRTFIFCEDVVRKLCKKYIVRGHIDVFINYTDKRENKDTVVLNAGIAKQYMKAAEELEKLGIENDLKASVMLRMPDVIETEQSEQDEQQLTLLLEEGTVAALEKLTAMREREGKELKSELGFRMENLKNIVTEIEKIAPEVAANYQTKLKAKLEDALRDIQIDESRFLTEVACFADKSNIDEEITRLKTHLSNGFEILEETNECGKKLDFLVQEINRELNTTGSKSNDIRLTQLVLAGKNELEKFREQVQNIE